MPITDDRVSMKRSQSIKRKIFKLVSGYYAETHKPRPFIPAKDYVKYSGRIYDERELINLVDSALDFWLTASKYADEFESKLARFVGVRHASLVNSGSSANLLAVSSLTSPLLGKRRLSKGDEVITTALCFPTMVGPIVQNGLIPVFVDIDLGTYNANIRQIVKAVGRKTKAVFLSHMLGNPFDIEAVKRICVKNGLWLIEDNSDSLGASYGGRMTGSFGDLASCSFYPAHHITTGEGGAVLTNDILLNKIINSFRDWGRDCWCSPGTDDTCGKRYSGKFGGLPKGYDHKYVYSHLGYNLKATDLQAAVGAAQMDKLPVFIKARNLNHKYLFDCLKHLTGAVILPVAERYSQPSWFGFMITLKDGFKVTRNEIIQALEKAKIQTRLPFAGNIIRQPCFTHLKSGREYRIAGSLENTDVVMSNSFWVGVYPGITGERREYMARCLKKVLGK